MKQQFVITHTTHQTELPTLLDSWVTSTPSVKMLYPQKNCFSLYFCKNVTCLYVGVLSNCQGVCVCGFPPPFQSPVKLCVMGYKILLVHEQYEGMD